MGQSREDSMGKNTLLCCLLLWGAAIGQEEVTDEVPPEEEEVVSENEVTEEEDDGHVSVHTFLGVAKGMKAETESGTPYFTFKGIPYAHPPVGSLRFQPPQPSSSWGETLVATEYGPVCPQQESFGENAGSYKGEEDCLYLNIYTPTLTRSSNPFALKAVMLWIHGGGFTSGSGSDYDPVHFMEKDVVVVTINYRLGALGFLTFGNDMATGNLGFRDQQLAIQWTRNYIRNFGGDPNKITIFGQSAGGQSVHAQVLSHHNQGLIHGAISQSGTMLQTPIADNPEEMAVKLAERFNCSSHNLDEEMLDCLQEISAPELIEGTALDPNAWFSGDVQQHWQQVGQKVFGPVVDHFCANPFLPIHPLEAIKTGAYNKIPFMSGTNKEDGALFTMMFWDSLEKIEENWDTMGPGILKILKNRNDIDEESKMIAQIVKKYYTGDDFTQDNKDSLTAMFGDAVFLKNDQKTVSHMSEGRAPVFNYLLTYKGSNSVASLFTESEEDFGVVHGDDLQYLLKTPLTPLDEFNEDDKKMIDLMVTYWSNFAKYGNPTPFKNAGIANWTPVRPDQKNYLDLQLEPSMKKDLIPERMLFWERMFLAPMEEDIERKVVMKKVMKFFMKNYARHHNKHNLY